MADSTAMAGAALHARRLVWANVAATALKHDDRIRAEWDRLNAERIDLPFLSADSIGEALEIFGRGNERLLIGNDGNRPAAMLVLVRQDALRWSTFQPSQIPLGAWVAERRLSLDEISRSLLDGPLRFCLALSITQIDPQMAPREPDTATTLRSDYIDTGWIDTTGSFEQYWSQRGKNLRQNMRKQRNKLAADGTNARMKVWQRVEEMAPAIARYGELESAGWKADEGTAIHPDNEQGRFYRRLLENAARRGEAAVYEYLFDDRVVAMNLCVLRGGVLTVLKTTYDESAKPFSPAFLLREEQLQATFVGRSIERMEFYGRMREWHTRFTENKRTLYHLTAYRCSILAKLAKMRRKVTDALG